jgi:hypothetical protein
VSGGARAVRRCAWARDGVDARYHDEEWGVPVRDDRALFVLRYVEKLELTEVAAALAWSLSKTKRLLPRVTARVTRLMQRDPALAEYATTTTSTTSNDNNRKEGDQR